MSDKQTDMAEVLGHVSSNVPLLTSYAAKMNAILTHFSERGLPLSVCADRQHLNRSVETLKKRARYLGLVFPDYMPRAMRPEPAKKKRKKEPQP